MNIDERERSLLRDALKVHERAGGILETKWVVVTGAPGSGKTTLVGCLSKMGFVTAGDPARELYLQDDSIGISPSDNRKTYLSFQERVLNLIEERMSNYSVDEKIVFDYGISECLAFLKISGIPWPDRFIQAAARVRFSRAIVLEPLELKDSDPVRLESSRQRSELHYLIQEIYQTLEMPTSIVPSAPVDARLDRILSSIDDAGLLV